MLVLNDIHVGFKRVGGTNMASHEALRSYLLKSFRETLDKSDEDKLVIMGDLFDDFEVTSRDLFDTYMILSSWVLKNKQLILVAGNHDHSPKGDKVSSFQLLSQIMMHGYGEMVEVVSIDGWLMKNRVWFVAHHSNQDSFDMTLKDLISEAEPGDRIFLHANFDNNFAAQSDHSLNVSRDVAREFISKGATLYFAHEHQARVALSGSVVVLGNQWPTSIVDCLGNDEKYAHVLKGGMKKIETWRRDDQLSEGSFAAGICGYGEVDWRELGNVDPNGADFIRVVGTASSNEAADAINAIAKFRQISTAFVIGNNVKVDGVAEAEDLPESFEAAKRFDVMEYIEQHLDADEMVVVNKLLEGIK